jgi:hypothetical protein
VGDGNLIGRALFQLKRAKLALKSNTFVLLSGVFDPILQFAVSFRELFQYFVGTAGCRYRRTLFGAKLHKLSNMEFVAHPAMR